MCLDTVVNEIHEAMTYFNIITNTFNVFFSSIIHNILNSIKRKVVLSLYMLQEEGTPVKIKKTLG